MCCLKGVIYQSCNYICDKVYSLVQSHGSEQKVSGHLLPKKTLTLCLSAQNVPLKWFLQHFKPLIKLLYLQMQRMYLQCRKLLISTDNAFFVNVFLVVLFSGLTLMYHLFEKLPNQGLCIRYLSSSWQNRPVIMEEQLPLYFLKLLKRRAEMEGGRK